VTTARDRAREAVRELAGDTRKLLRAVFVTSDGPADAASDVWEPLLRELVGAVESWLAVDRADETAREDAWADLHVALAAAKEALGASGGSGPEEDQ
jgi:hypothetical protein